MINEKKIKSDQVIEPENFNKFISNLKGKKIIIDKNTCSIFFENILKKTYPNIIIERKNRFSQLTFLRKQNFSKLEPRSAIIAFNINKVYEIAENIRTYKGGTAVVLGSLSPRTRNAQVEVYENKNVDYLVATDAIGMGLNLNINHVSFSSLEKFDGRYNRNLAPNEFEEAILKYNDDILGSSNADKIFSQSGSDSITGSGGDDRIDGGSGNDKAIFSGNLGSYKISVDNVTYTVKDLRENSPDGTDKIEYVEYLVFNDQTITPSEAVKIDSKRNINNGLTSGENYRLENIRDFDGNLHGGGDYSNFMYSYKYQGKFDVNNDGLYEHVFTNKESGRWVTASVNSTTGLTDFSDYGKDGTTRIVGIYIDPLVQSGEVIKDSDFDSQRRFQNDLEIDNLLAKTAGDFDSDGFQEVYWKTADSTAYLRALMHDDGNIQYANYQSESQMTEYLTANGFSSTVSDIIS